MAESKSEGARGGGTAVLEGRSGVAVAAPERGRTSIADGVVEKIAGTAAREVPGVRGLGAGMSRTLGAMRDRIPGSRSSVTRGVGVEVGERQAAVDLDVVVDYGLAITDLAADIRINVIETVERMTGLEVVEVNIAVDDVQLPEEEEPSGTAEGRVK